jgi:hypothetical protein
MPRKPVRGDHPDPAVDVVFAAGAPARIQVGAQVQELALRVHVEKHRKVELRAHALLELERAETRIDFAHVRHFEPRPREHGRERVDVVREHAPATQRGFDRRRAASAERVVHDIAFVAQPVYEIRRELRLEACAIGDFVYRRCLALAARPELLLVYRNVRAAFEEYAVAHGRTAPGSALDRFSGTT